MGHVKNEVYWEVEPVVAMLCVEFAFGTGNILFEMALEREMNHIIIVA